ncbi:MAG: CoA-binding protein [Caldilineales bacterium]|nr:CoA-binding protein [Caldilineales bacterium]
MNDSDVINHLLESTRRIAVVGLSSRRSRAGFYVPEYLQRAGYKIIPVNPNLDSALGEKAYPDLDSAPHGVDLVLIFRRSEFVPPVVDEAIRTGAGAVWMQLGIVNNGAAQLARAAGMDVVMDACMMVEHRRWAASRT